jgi:hypothetical protein
VAQFLSDAWLEEADKIRAEFHGKVAPPTQQVKINLVVTAVPFGDGTVKAHIDTSEGDTEIESGHLDDATTTLTTDYETARAVFIDQNQQAALQAFMSGKVQISGDMTKIMAMMQGTPDEAALEIAARLKAVTDD